MKSQQTYLLQSAWLVAALLNVAVCSTAEPAWEALGSGIGPEPAYGLWVWDGKLIVFGLMTTAGGQPVNGIASWDGETWSELGEGWVGVAGVTTYEGALAANGIRGQGAPAEIAKWDGNEWTTLALSDRSFLVGYRDKLYQASWSDLSDPVVAWARVSEYDGALWREVGAWYQPAGTLMDVSDLMVVDDTLYVQIGANGWCYVFDGSSWQPRGSTFISPGDAGGFAKVGQTLYVGGEFLSFPHIARWTGFSWEDVWTDWDDYCSRISAVEEFNGRLVVSGWFVGPNCTSVPDGTVAAWDGAEWESLGTLNEDGVPTSFVYDFTVYDGKLIAAGRFDEADGVPALNIAQYTMPVPVAITRFDARRHEQGVVLAWEIYADVSFDGFDVYRSENSDPDRRVNVLPLSTETREYVDHTVEPGKRYSYVLVARGTDTGEVRSQRAEIDIAPIDVALHQNTPNPFNPTTTIRFDVAEVGRVTIGVYNSGGATVRTLVDAEYGPGNWSTTWDGTDQSGTRVASGVYYYRMQVGKVQRSKKMILLK